MTEKGEAILHGIDPARVGAVVFDLGGVFLEGTLEKVFKFGELVGLSEKDWFAIREKLFLDGGPWEELERGEIALDTFAEVLQRFLAELGATIDLERARNFMGSPGDSFALRLRGEIVEACRALHAIMPTALLTNNIAEWRAEWRGRLELDALFDHVIDSSEVGMRKPEPAIYRLTEQMLGRPAEELLFIDDMGMNLKAARLRGWQTLKYDDTAKVLAVLEAVAANGASR